jgi:hypothetical protein
MASVFVFGSNLAGRHGKGSALEAVKNHGAIRGVGWGRQGDSYAIPTKDFHLRTLPLPMIQYFCRVFLDHARMHPGDTFKVVEIGCGLAGYKPRQIAPFFDYAPRNVHIPYSFIY